MKIPYETDSATLTPALHMMYSNEIVVSERQARIVDISRYWRTGGTNWPLVAENFDAVVICAGIGTRMDVLLPEHTELAEEHGVPYGTFHIPDPLVNMPEQAHWYLEQPGVRGHKQFFDCECPYVGSREPTSAEGKAYIEVLEDPALYSRAGILKAMGLPSWLKNYKLWIARYLYEGPSYTEQYKTYEPFLEQRGWTVPPGMIGTGLEQNVIGWQFTERGDARFYAANRLTKDPVYVYGMTNADLNASIGDSSEFLRWFIGDEEPEPDPEPTGCNVFMAKIAKIVDEWKEQ